MIQNVSLVLTQMLKFYASIFRKLAEVYENLGFFFCDLNYILTWKKVFL